MSIQAVGWALEQDLPARPKLVLVSIANHADHRTGYCYLKAETIAEEASCSPRGVFNFVGDLIRNGFIRKETRKGEDGKQRAPDYWILFARAPAAWNSDRRADEHEAEDVEGALEDEPATSCEPVARGATGESEDENARRADGPSAPACSGNDSAEPSESKPKASSARATTFADPPRKYRPPPPEPMAADTEQPQKPIFVFKGSRAWWAWKEERKRQTGIDSLPHTTTTIDGERREGWWFPSLFPPSDSEKTSEEATGPPHAA